MNILRTQATLAHELKFGLTRRVSFAIFLIGLVSTGLHFAWSVHQKTALVSRIRDAVAETLQEPIRSNNLIAIKNTVKAFRLANESTHICIKLPHGVVLQEPSCENPDFRPYSIPFSTQNFFVSVNISPLDFMTLAGIPFVLAAIVLLILVFRYLRSLSKRIAHDLDHLLETDTKVTFYYSELSDANRKVIENRKLEEEKNRIKIEAELGTRLAEIGHNIPAPARVVVSYAADLENLAKRFPEVSECAIQIKNASVRVLNLTERLKDETKNLLRSKQALRHTTSARQLSNLNQPQGLVALLKTAISEKQARYRDKSEFLINFDTRLKDYDVFANVNADEFQNVISNLVDNAVEAIEKAPGFVRVTLSEPSNHRIKISIHDNGRGISEDELPQLMKKGVSFRENGTGLGLFHAKTTTESWGGTIKILSTPGIGTVVAIDLPIFERVPETAKLPRLPDSPLLLAEVDAVQIDNEEYARLYWQKSANDNDKNLISLNDLSSFWKISSTLKKNVEIYIDEHLDNSVLGQNAAREVFAAGFQNIYLSTEAPAEFFGPLPWVIDVLDKTPPWERRTSKKSHPMSPPLILQA